MTGVRLAIVGTRVMACPGEDVGAAMRIGQEIDRLRPDVVISGGAKGIDRLAESVANLRGYIEDDGTLIIHRPTVRRFHGPGGFRERDARIAADCTHLLRIACVKATTYGSGWTADEAERLGRIVVRDSVCRDDT